MLSDTPISIRYLTTRSNIAIALVILCPQTSLPCFRSSYYTYSFSLASSRLASSCTCLYSPSSVQIANATGITACFHRI